MNIIRAWNRFWFAPTSARPLAAFRIVFGLVALVNLAFLTFDLDHWATDVGLLTASEAVELAGPLRPSPLQHFGSPAAVRGAYLFTAVAFVTLTIGWRTRVAAVLSCAGMLSIHHRILPTNSGADTLLMTLSFLMMFADSGAAYSLDARRAARRRGTRAEALIEPWPQRLIQIQITVIYFVTAALKCNGQSWLGGTALHWVLNNTEVRRFSLQPLPQYPLLINAMTLGALVVEFGLAYLLWVKAARPYAIASGLALHVGIVLVVNIPIFGELMTACYLTFLTAAEWDAITARLDPWLWRRPRASDASIAIATGRADRNHPAPPRPTSPRSAERSKRREPAAR